MSHDRQVVEPFFDKQPNDAIRVENEVSSFRVLISDHAAKARSIREEQTKERKHGSYVNNAMSCGVCGRTWTFSNGTSFETVAVGFSAAGRYFGPSPCSGAGEETPLCVLVAIVDNQTLVLYDPRSIGAASIVLGSREGS
jgi:hypothetical protein